jgi:hypothetical protein
MEKLSVTQIISEIWPFDPKYFNDALLRDALLKKGVVAGGIADLSGSLSRTLVMDVLSNFGTQMHACAQDLMLLGKCPSWRGAYLESHVRSLVQFFKDYQVQCVVSERRIEGPEYTGTADGVILVTDTDGRRKKWVIDWKSWGAYKFIYGILDDKGKSKSGELKKVGLQTSMYAELLEPEFGPFDGLAAIWVHEDGYKVFPLKRDLTPYTQYKMNKNVKSGLSLPGM